MVVLDLWGQSVITGLVLVGVTLLSVSLARPFAVVVGRAYRIFLMAIPALGVGLALSASVAPGPGIWSVPGSVVAAVGLGSIPVLAVWGGLVVWARRLPSPPMVDAARLRWSPRASHRPTWVIAGFAGAIAAVLLASQGATIPVVGISMGLAGAWWWAHRGQRGPVRIEARELVVGRGQLRIPLDEIVGVGLQTDFLGPIGRSRICVAHPGGCLGVLVSGSTEADIDAVVRLLSRQVAWVAEHAMDRPRHAPPAGLDALRGRGKRATEIGGRPPGADTSTG